VPGAADHQKRHDRQRELTRHEKLIEKGWSKYTVRCDSDSTKQKPSVRHGRPGAIELEGQAAGEATIKPLTTAKRPGIPFGAPADPIRILEAIPGSRPPNAPIVSQQRGSTVAVVLAIVLGENMNAEPDVYAIVGQIPSIARPKLGKPHARHDLHEPDRSSARSRGGQKVGVLYHHHPEHQCGRDSVAIGFAHGRNRDFPGAAG